MVWGGGKAKGVSYMNYLSTHTVPEAAAGSFLPMTHLTSQPATQTLPGGMDLLFSGTPRPVSQGTASPRAEVHQ